MTPLRPLVSAEVGNESVNRYPCDLNRGSLAYACCAFRYIEDLQLRITSAERLIKQVSQRYQSTL